jgi:hypothetical protein
MSAHTALARAMIARCQEEDPVQFPARARVVQTDVGHRRIFDSRCGRYRISETRYSCKALKSRWYALKRDELGWGHVGKFRHHTTHAACLAAIEADALAVKKGIGS